eukprot:COSAG01_NODE_16506_length_1231_cov_1.239399_2_plen_69_part_01
MRRCGHSKWNSITEFISNSDKMWVNLGSGYASPYGSDSDPRLEELLSNLSWFRQWKDDVMLLPITPQRS